MLTKDYAILPATHTFIRRGSITSLWLVLVSRPTVGRRLSWPGWVCEILRWFIRQTVTHPRGGVSRKFDARLTKRQSLYSTGNIIVHNLLFKFAALLQIETLEKLKYSLELMQGPEP